MLKNQKEFLKHKILGFGLIFCLLILGTRGFCFAEDKIVAIVNNDIITQRDLNSFLNFMRVQFSKQHQGKELESKIQSMRIDLLTRLIEDQLILQEAKKSDVKIDENRIEAKMAEIKHNYPTNAEFQKDIKKQGLTEADIESKIRDQLLMFTVVDQKIRSRIQIRPDEVTTFFERNPKEFQSQESRELTVVSLENEDQAKSFYFDLKVGKKLTDLAAIYPITVNKLNAVSGEGLRKEIEEIVFKLPLEGISEPSEIEGKYYIFILDGLVSPKQLSLGEVKDKIYSYLFEKKMQEEMTKWLDEIRKKSYVKILQN